MRPMTQQDTSRNNLTISTFRDTSVPIVSQTEIDPMKTALSIMLRRHDDGPQPSRRPYRKPPGRAARARTAISHRARSACRRRALRTPSPTLRPLLTRRDDGAESAAAEKTVDALERSLTPAFFLSNLLAYPCSIGAVSILETGHAPSPVTVCLAGIGGFLLAWSDWLGWIGLG